MTEGRLKALQPTYEPPDRGDQRYVRRTEHSLGARELNGRKRIVRRVVVSGMKLTLHAGNSSDLLKTTRADDVAEVYIVADDLTIATPLAFPGANVYIYARSLTFADEASLIDTSPPPPQTVRAPGKIDGRDGLPAGNITVIVDAYHPATQTAKHLQANGGRGEPGDDGGLISETGTRRDVQPLTAQDWTKLMAPSNRRVRHEDIMWSEGYVSTMPGIDFDKIQGAKPNTLGTLTYAEINNSYYTDNFHLNQSRATVIAGVGSKGLPGTGADAAPPGRPGTGGSGGSFIGREAMAASFQGDGGKSGPQRQSSPGGAGGSPKLPLWVFFEGRPSGARHLFTTRWEIKERATLGNSSGPGPLPRSPTGPMGTVKPVTGDAAYAWVNPVSLQTALSYAHDAIAAKHWPTALDALAPYLRVCAPAAATPSLRSDRGAVTRSGRGRRRVERGGARGRDHLGGGAGLAGRVRQPGRLGS
jgi:hypothetical protein